MNGVQAKKVVGYMVLPGIIPRAHRLFASGFGYIAFLIATIFNIVRLLPANHPYLIPANMGRFGIRHVIAEAANNLVVSRRNIDQIIIFIVILTGIVIMGLQILLALYGYLFKPAMAVSLFATEKPQKDIAFMLLDEVFGIPNIYKSCISTMQACKQGGTPSPSFPWAFHDGLQSMFQFYSLGLLIVGLVIFFYFVLVIIVETAATGHPFGQRFQNVWVPIRLVVALGLLVPISHGLNSSQYIVLYAAKWGSGFATNVWLRYNDVIGTGKSGSAVFKGKDQNPAGERESLLALPQTPSTAPTVQTLSLAHACAYAYWKTNPMKDKNGNVVQTPPPPSGEYEIRPYLVKNVSYDGNATNYMRLTSGVTYDQALRFYSNADIFIVFGKLNEDKKYSKYPGNVIPLCGTVRIPISYLKNRNEGSSIGGPDQIQQYWFDMVKDMWFANTDLATISQFYVETKIQSQPPDDACAFARKHTSILPQPISAAGKPCEIPPLSSEARQKIVNSYNSALKTTVSTAWNKYNTSGKDIQITEDILDRGWAGAGIWYNIIADINGGFVSAVINLPLPVSYPMLMEQVREAKRKADADTGALGQFAGKLADNKIFVEDPAQYNEAEKVARILGGFFEYWNTDGADQATTSSKPIGNFILDVMNMLFGTSGLMDMRGSNANVYPLAQLAALGKGLVDSAIIYVGVGVISAAGGGLLGALGGSAGQLSGALLQLASEISISLAFLGLTAGVLLYYIVPLMPFMYFFFAVATWVKGIFEAMVGAPLWALAHLRFEGEGLPGDAASNGYFIILDLFLRPVLSIISLIGAMLILTAQVRVLNIIWDLVIGNLTGFIGSNISQQGTARGVVDGYFFTVLYAIMIYMLATSSFKLIDAIPDNVLRFLGANAQSFSAANPDGTEGLVRNAAIGGITFGQQVTSATRGLAAGIGQDIGGMLRRATDSIGPKTGP